MSQVSLFRRWRSKAFSDLVGQEAVVRTLRNVLAGGSPARAYLFCGPRGTGKTSTARIFAKALCCEQGPTQEPCNQCSTCREIALGNCLDVFEIDAASNTQVEKIRDFIVDKVHFAPAKARYKVYIIDEVHKLSSSSFNALLKTLEEPPAHVVFILATTHPHDLLPTILSRCQRYDFRAFTLVELGQHLAAVAEAEGFSLEDGACQMLARAAQGSMRDALVLLEQACHYCSGAVGSEQVGQMLGLLPQETLAYWVESLSSGQVAPLLQSIQEMHTAGQDFVRAVDLWVEHLRWLMLAKAQAYQAGLNDLSETYRLSLLAQAESLALGQILSWLKGAVELQQAIRDGQPARIALELSLVSLSSASQKPTLAPSQAGAPSSEALTRLQQQMEALQQRVERLQLQPSLTSSTSVPPPPPKDPGPTSSPTPKVPPAPATKAKGEAPPVPKVEAKLNDGKPVRQAKEFWPHLLEMLRQRDVRLMGILNDARLKEFSLDRVVVSVPFEFHFKKIQEALPLLEEVGRQLLQSPVKFEVVQEGTAGPVSQDEQHENLVKKASGLFGGRVLGAANDHPSD